MVMCVQEGTWKRGSILSYCVIDDNLLIKNDVGILSLVKIWLSTQF